MQIGARWPTEDYQITVEDYIYGLVIEHPRLYFLVPKRNLIYVYVAGKGMVRVFRDFRGMTEEDVDSFVNYIRETI